MAEYDGPIHLLDERGEIIDRVEAHLIGYKEGGQSAWSGHIRPVALADADWMAAKRIRLSDGREGDIIMINVDVSSSATGAIQSGQLQGSGPAPF